MSEHRATIAWKRTTPDFGYDTYNRQHEWVIEGGLAIPASSAPEYRGHKDRLDPERALVGALSSCHMLTFLAIAARKKFVVDAYDDDAVGVMTKNEKGKMWVSHVTLHPRITFGGDHRPSAEEIAAMHHSAHENCFIANSVMTQVVVEPAA
ncbi:MAG: OsmC family protein [Alphaproteobacteria bacterium]|nr:OsmC family protein [Alphaproteobacteria bacterium]